MAWITRAEIRGPVGSVDAAEPLTLPPGSPASAEISGPPEHRVLTVGIPEGKRGLPGVNAVENDTAVATYLAAPDSESGQQLRATITDETTPPIAKRAIVVYGHSYTIAPSPHSTDGHEFFNLIAAASGSPSVVTHGVSSGRAVQTSWDVNGQPPGSAQPGTKLFIVDTEANDFAHRIANGSYYNAWSANVAPLFTFGVAAILARLSARAVVEQSEGTTTGTWTRNSPFIPASGGTFDYTTENGAYIDVPVTITAEDSGVVFVSLIWMAIANGRANVEISVDGTLYKTITHSPAVMPERLYSGRVTPIGTGDVASFFDPVRVSGLTIGAHTIRIKHVGVTGHRLNVDSVLIQSASPEPVVWLRDQAPVAGRDLGLAIDDAKVAIYKANKAQGIAASDPIFAEFPNVIVIEQTDYLDAGSVSTTDGLHPNDKGNARMAQRIIRELAVRGENAD